jgi:hypothetical protein
LRVRPEAEHLKGASLGEALALPANTILGWKRLARDKRSSLLLKIVTYSCKKFCHLGPRRLVAYILKS